MKLDFVILQTPLDIQALQFDKFGLRIRAPNLEDLEELGPAIKREGGLSEMEFFQDDAQSELAKASSDIVLATVVDTCFSTKHISLKQHSVLSARNLHAFRRNKVTVCRDYI